MTREEIDKVCHIVHSTILTFMSEEEGVMSKDELLLLNVNKAICTEIKRKKVTRSEILQV